MNLDYDQFAPTEQDERAWAELFLERERRTYEALMACIRAGVDHSTINFLADELGIDLTKGK